MEPFSFRTSSIILWAISIALLFGPSDLSDPPKQRTTSDDPTTLVFPTFLHTYGIRKATRFHLFLFTQNKAKFMDPQGLAVVRLNAWEDTTTTSDDDEVTVYGVNSGQNCIIYNTSMKSIGIYGLDETGEGRLLRPRGIAANEKGEVYIADTGNHRLVKLFNPGHSLKFDRSTGKLGTAPGCFKEPSDVAVDSQGRVFVTDSGNHRIQIFSSELEWSNSWGKYGQSPGQLHYPTAIAVVDKKEQWNYYHEELVVIIDLKSSRIQLFTPEGKFIRAVTAAQFGYPRAQLAYLAMDYYNNIYATDTRNHCIHKFDHRLNYLTSYGSYGSDDRQFIEPRGITIYRRFGQVFVAEKWGAQYYWIGTDCFDFQVIRDSVHALIEFKYFLTEPSFITADILDEQKLLVNRLFTRQFHYSGWQSDFWSGYIWNVLDSVFSKENYRPSPLYKPTKSLPRGRYFVKYKIEPTYSSYHYFHKTIVRQWVR